MNALQKHEKMLVNISFLLEMLNFDGYLIRYKPTNMCKRFSFKASKEQIEQQFNIPVTTNLRWSYNIAPTQHAYVLLNDAPDRIQYITWGLIPANSRDGKNEGKLINARKEGIAVSSSFRIPIRSQRCLIMADSFYIFQKVGLEDVPYRVTLQDKSIMLFAGIWDTWYHGDYAVKSFSIITKPTTGALKNIVPRMPVVIHESEAQTKWMENISLSDVQSITDLRDPDTYQFYKISRELHSTQKNDASLHDIIDQ